MAVLLTAFVVFSQQINIRGTITDTTGVTTITGAVVKLEKHGYTDTTGANGSFVLTGIVSIGQNIQQLQPNALSASMRNGMLSLYVPERGAVSITTYTIQGKAVSKIEKVMDVGAHSIAQPDLGHGVYIYKIRTGSRELVVKSSSDREALRTKALLKEFDRYVTELNTPKPQKLKEVRLEALRAGFRSCFDKKDFQTIVTMGDKIHQNLLLEDEQLLMFYDIAKDRV